MPTIEPDCASARTTLAERVERLQNELVTTKSVLDELWAIHVALNERVIKLEYELGFPIDPPIDPRRDEFDRRFPPKAAKDPRPQDEAYLRRIRMPYRDPSS